MSVKSFLEKKNSGQFVFTLGGLFLGLISIALFMGVLLNATNVTQNMANFSDSAKLLFAVVPFFFLVGVFMVLINNSQTSQGYA